MATPARINILNPWRVWMLLTVLNTALFAGATFMVNAVAESENKRLAELQLDILAKSRLENLDRGDFRSLTSGLGGEASKLYVKVSDGVQTFEIGSVGAGVHCAQAVVPLTRPDSGGAARTATLTLCRPFSSPVRAITWIGGIFLLVSATGIVAAFRLDRAVTGKLLAFFRNHGVNVGSSEGFAGVLGHIDELNRSLQAAKEEAVEAARAKAFSEMAEQVAHDIRSPLAAIKIEVDNLKSYIPAGRNRLLIGATERISMIAENLLLQNRAARRIRRSPARLSDLISQVISEKKVEFQGRRLTTEFCDGAPNAIVVIDSQELQRVLSNLINNAADACADLETAGHVVVTSRTADGQIHLTIRDNGPGFPPEVVGLAGTRGLSSGKTGGNGLGLYHARKTVVAFGGHLHTSNLADGGACVTITWPATEISDAAQLKTQQLDGCLRCVLIDDDVFVREAWEHAVNATGGRILSVGSYAELRGALESIAYDTPIFLDSDIGPDERGEDIALYLHQLGFQNIYLSTGYDRERFAGLTFLSGVLGKEPPSWLLT